MHYHLSIHDEVEVCFKFDFYSVDMLYPIAKSKLSQITNSNDKQIMGYEKNIGKFCNGIQSYQSAIVI